MSDNERPDLRAFNELQTLVRHLGEELAAFRRRALMAESQLRDAGHPGGKGGDGAVMDRVVALERENATLRARLREHEESVQRMLDRVRFLRQQVQHPVAGATAGAPGGKARGAGPARA